MAKTTPGLKAALAAVKSAGKAMNKEAMGDYKVTINASNAGQANLSKQTRALTRDLLLGLKGNQAGLRAGVLQSQQTQKDVRQAQARTTNRYGSALGETIANSYGQAGASAKAGTMIAKGEAAAGRTNIDTGKTVSKLAGQATAAQKESAKYMLAQALMARNVADAGTIASLTGQLYQTALQSQMSWDLWKKQQDYLAKQEAGTQGLGGMTTVATQLSNASSTMRGYVNEYATNPDTEWLKAADLDGDGILQPSELVTLYTSREGIISEAELPALTALARGLPGNDVVNRGAEVQNVLSAMHQLYPQFHGKKDSILDAVRSQLDSTYDAQALAAKVAQATTPTTPYNTGGTGTAQGNGYTSASGQYTSSTGTGTDRPAGTSVQGSRVDLSTEKEWPMSEPVPVGWAITAMDKDGKRYIAQVF